MSDYETVVGLEVHVELKTESKIFCSCPTKFGGAPNAQICEVCAGLPGALPRLNRKVVDFALLTALALHCEVTRESRFDRKNYFYPDLPKGYQISQLYAPIGRDGFMDINISGKKEDSDVRDKESEESVSHTKRIRIHELHMEDDAGKLTHDEASRKTFIDLSRCGVPLLEIVTEPDFRSSEEVVAFLETLRTMLKFIGVSDCKMQEGSLRADVNLSVREVGETTLGTRTEMKNLSSFRAVAKAISYEADRQWKVISEGGTIERETRRWDEEKEISLAMRKKEDTAEYKYFPEPDLPILHITSQKLEETRAELPELPQERKNRYVTQMGLPKYDAGLLSAERKISELFEKTAQICGDPKEASNWMMGDFMKLLNDTSTAPEDIEIREESLGEIILMVKEGRISRASAKEVLRSASTEDSIPEEYATAHDLWLVRDEAVLMPIVQQVLDANEKAVNEYRAGKTKNFQFLLGQSMRATKGKADPSVLSELVTRALQN